MAVAPGTRVVGKVEYRNDKFAIVTPVYQDTGSGWEDADPADYPTRGQVFWWNPQIDVHPGSVALLDIEERNSQKDTFAVTTADFLFPVIDLAAFEYDEALERLTSGRLDAGPEVRSGKDVFAWCKNNLLLGPLTPKLEGTRFFVPSDSLRLERVPYREQENAIFAFPNSRYYCAPTSPVTGHLDCRSDAQVLRTAIRDAVAIAEKTSINVPDFLATKAMMQSAADALRDGDRLDDRQYKLDRIVRALKICSDSDEVHTLAGEVSSLLLEHPTIRTEIDRGRVELRSQMVAVARESIQVELENERQQVSLLREEKSSLEHERSEAVTALEKTRQELTSAKDELSSQLESLENSVADRVADLVDDATDLLTDSVLLRALGVGSTPPAAAAPVIAVREVFTEHSSPSPTEPTPVRDALRHASEGFGIDLVTLTRIHAAVRAGLIPVTTGNGGSAALTAYSTTTYGGRHAQLPVAHDFLHPVDLLGVRASDPTKTRMHAGLLLGADAAVRAGEGGVLVLESFNRAPTESYLLPWLQTHDQGIAVPDTARQIVGRSRVVPHPDLKIAATAIAGITTAPLSPDVWGFAVAIDVPRAVRARSRTVAPSFVKRPPLPIRPPAVDKMVSGIDASLGGYWPVDEGLLDTARRFATALAEVQDDGAVAESITECVLVPALATSLSGPELLAAVDAVLGWSSSQDPNRRQTVHRLAQRFHRRFA